MNPEIEASIKRHAVAEYPRDACGVIVVTKGKETYLPCRNQASDAEEHFVIHRDDMVTAEAAGEIVAIVHSHPDMPSRPSEADLVGCELHEVPWVIVSVMPGPIAMDVRTIEPSAYEAPLIGREWSHGLLDCWALCRDWYARERGAILPDPVRNDGWWDDGCSDLYGESAMAAAGFVRAAVADGNEKAWLGELQVGDLVLMQIRSKNLVPNHAAIYIGSGNILHHLHGRLSSRDVYGGYWQHVTRSVWRLNGLRGTS